MVSLITSIDTGHEDIVTDAEIDYYGLQMATCAHDNVVKVFSIKNGAASLVSELKGHYGPVWRVTWAHPKFGNILATCSFDRKVIVWKETKQEWTKIYEYFNHEASVNCVKFAPHEYGLIFACGSSDGSISIVTSNPETNVWESKKLANAHATGCNSVSWCLSGKKKRLVSGGCDALVKIWEEEPNGWEEKCKLDNHADWVRDVAWGPSICSPRGIIASCSQDKRVIIWTNDDDEKGANNWTPVVLNTFEDIVWNLSWSLTGNILAVSCADNKVTLWKEDGDGVWRCMSDVNSHHNPAIDQRAL